MSNIKKIDIKEFRNLGYLQEVNRKFFHPLGLALEIIVDDNGDEFLGGIWDYRDDEIGIYYDIKNSDSDRKSRFLKNKRYIQNEFNNRKSKRIEKFGSIIEKI